MQIQLILTILALSLYTESRHVSDLRNVVKRACSVYPTYDVVCHGTCPGVDTSDWIKNKVNANCTDPKTYHCAYKKDGEPFDGCVVPIDCDRGEEPILYEEEGNIAVECHLCKEPKKYFNSKSRKSDSFSECFQRKEKCDHHSEEECPEIDGNDKALYYAQTRCTCNWKNNYIPELISDISPCFRDTRCVYSSCSGNLVLMSDFKCHSKCDEGMERINDTCVHKSSYETKSTPSTTQVQTTTITTTSTQKATSTSDESDGKSKADSGSKPANTVWIVIGCAVAIAAIVIYIICHKRGNQAVTCCHCFNEYSPVSGIPTGSGGNTQGVVTSSGPTASTSGVVTSSGAIASTTVVVTSSGPIASTSGIVTSSGPIACTSSVVTSSGPIANTPADVITSSGAIASTTGVVTSLGPIASTSGVVTSSGPIASTSDVVTSSGPKASTSGDVTSSGCIASTSGVVTSSGAIASRTGVVTSSGPIASTSGVVTSSGSIASTSDVVTSSGHIASTSSVTCSGPVARTSGAVTSSGPIASTSGVVTPSGLIASASGDVTSSGLKASTTDVTETSFNEPSVNPKIDDNNSQDHEMKMGFNKLTENNESYEGNCSVEQPLLEYNESNALSTAESLQGEYARSRNNDNAVNSNPKSQGKEQRKKLQEKIASTGLEYRDISRRALRKNNIIFKDKMDTERLQYKLEEKMLFDECDLKDLNKLKIPSERTKLILDLLVERYVLRDEDIYHSFKECLDEIGQGYLVDKLENSEDKIIAKLTEKKRVSNEDSQSDSDSEALV